MKFSNRCGKNSYTKNEIDRVLNNIYNKRKVYLRTYFCKDCGKYHMTSNLDDKYTDGL